MTLSLSMIVRDESLTLGRILQQASEVCDEMIVVDTGSTDNTKQIALDHGAKVWDFEWIDDFAAARNFSLSKCRGDWVMWLDADDVLPVDSRLAIRNLDLASNKAVNAILCPYHCEYDLQGHVIQQHNCVRLFRNIPRHKWVASLGVHEYLAGTERHLPFDKRIVIEHRTHPANIARKASRNIGIADKHPVDIDTARLDDVFNYANVLKCAKRFVDAARVYERWLVRVAPNEHLFAPGATYSALLLLADTYRVMNEPAKALDAAYKCLQLDPARAEAFSLLGIIYLECLKCPSVAWPFFVAATQCPLPPPETFAVHGDYYRSVPLHQMPRCLAAMNSRQPADKLSEIAGTIQARLQPVPIPAQAAQSHR
jgi:glycosyltransferase involved in cell wall biosynthesis